MATIAELKVIVDASQIDKAKESLKSFNDAADKVQTASSKISSGMKDASGGSAEFSGAAEKLIARVKELEATVGMSKGGVLSYKATLLGVNDVVKPLASSFDSLTAAQKNNDAISKEVARSQALADTEKHKMLESLKEEIALYGKSKSEIQMYRAEQLGIIDSVRPLVEELNRLKEAKESADKAGKSGGEGLTKKQQELELLRQEGQAIQENLNHLKNTSAIEADRKRIQAEFAANQAKYESKKIEIEEVLALRDAEKSLADAKAGSKKATTDELNEFKKFRGEVDPTKKSLEKYYDQLAKIQELRKVKGKGGAAGVDLEELNQLETVVNRNIKTLENYGATTGKTAKEIAFSMRGLPAQFTDIAVSLQGGQKPLTVFLQQGGQLKDMFGGIVPALQAMGSYVMSLVTPFTVLGATFAGLAYLAYSGHKEMSELNKALTLSGKSAVITSTEVNQYVSAISDIKGTSSAAIEVLTALVAKTDIHKDSIVDVSAATIAWSSATGESIDSILEDFNSLTKDPVSSVVTLSEKYKFLTVELYNNIKALKEAGDEMGAAKLATEALSDSLVGQELILKHTRSAWGDLASWVGGGIKSLASGFSGLFGMDKDNLEILRDKRAAYQELVEIRQRMLADDPTNEVAAHFLKEDLKKIEEIDKALSTLSVTQKALADTPVNKALDELTNQYTSSADGVYKAEKAFKDYMNSVRKAFDANTGEFLGTSEQFNQYEERRAKLLRDVQVAVKVTSGSELLEQAENNNIALKETVGLVGKVGTEQKKLILLQKEISELQEKSNRGEWLSDEEKGKLAAGERLIALQQENVEIEKASVIAKKTSVVRNTAADTLLSRLQAQQGVLKEQLNSEEQLGVEAKTLIRLKEELGGIEVKARTTKLSLDEQSKLNARDALLSQQLKNKSLEDEIRAKAKVIELERYNIGLQKELDAGKQRIDDLKNSSGKGDREIARTKELNSVRLEGARAIRELEVNEAGKDGYAEKLASLEEFNAARLQQTIEMHQIEDEIQANAWAGMKSGWQDYLESNLNMYATLKDAAMDVYSTIQGGVRDSLVQNILYGESLRDTFSGVARVVQEKVLGAMIDVGLQFAINASEEALGLTTIAATKKTVEASTTAASLASMSASTAAAVASGAAITAAYTPAAIAASIASFGGAAVSATASIATQTPIMAASIASTKLAGFREGGYTGNKGVDDIAGVVHGREFVFDAESTSRIGVNNLEKIRSGKTGGGDTIISTNITVTAEEGMSESDARSQGEAAAEGFETRVLSIIANQRRAGGMLSTS